MGKTNIAWTEQTWNPVTGCTPVSVGCAHCYAAAEHKRRANGPRFYKDGKRRPTQYDYSFSAMRCHPERLREPLSRRKPTIYFVNSGSDTFHHHGVPDVFLGAMFATMVRASRHLFLLLTKRPENVSRALGPKCLDFYAVEGSVPCPQPNIAIGTSCENQETANERIPWLLDSPAAMRFLSLEPLLGTIDLSRALANGDTPAVRRADVPRVDWVIVGCESGPKHRPMELDWVRDIRDQCEAAGVPLFFKQAFEGNRLVSKPPLDGRQWIQEPAWLTDWRKERDGH